MRSPVVICHIYMYSKVTNTLTQQHTVCIPSTLSAHYFACRMSACFKRLINLILMVTLTAT